jgi:hypothetical protein
MTDAKPAGKNETSDAAALLAHAADSHADTAVKKFRAEAQTEKTGIKTEPKSEPINWRSELQNATTEIKKLEQLKTGDPASAKERHDLIQSIDKHFQKALPMVRQDATSADSELLVNVARATVSDKDFRSFKVNGKTIDPESTKMDDIHNAILNAPDEATRKQLTRLGVLAENRDVAMNQVDASYWKSKAPMMAALDYANFLIKHKDGITQDSKGNAFSAGDILNASMSREMAASPQGKDLIRLAADSIASHENLLIPSEKNPMIALARASEATDPKVALAKLQQAAELAKDKYFDPENLKREIDAAKNDHSPEGLGKLAALQGFTHARGLTELSLGTAQAATGNNTEAVGHLLNAAKDPAAAESFRDNTGRPIFDRVLAKAMNSGEHSPFTAIQDYHKADTDAVNHYNNWAQLAAAGKGDDAAKELKLASASADEALKKGREIKSDIGPENCQKIKDEFNVLTEKSNNNTLKPEEKAMLDTITPLVEAQSFESQALFKRAKIDNAGNNHNSAVAELEALQKLDPAFVAVKDVKADYDEQMQRAKDGAEYDNAGWAGKAWLDTKTMGKHAWEYVTEHPKLVAATIALGTAAVIVGVASGGTAVPFEAALAASLPAIGWGTAAGTVAGAGMEYASGKNTNVAYGALDVLPSAFLGAAAGASGMGALRAVQGAEALSPFAARALRGTIVGAVPAFYQTYSHYESGQDKNLVAAAYDFAATDLAYGAGFGLLGKAGWVAKAAGAFTMTSEQVTVPLGNYYLNKLPLSARFDKNSVTLPDATETPQPEQ